MIKRDPLFTTPQEAFLWLESFHNAEKNGIYDSRIYRLDRMRILLTHFENPHQKIPSVHIAGSKGKGSTAAILASILTQSGLKTGLYTSPHLTDYRERITLNGKFFKDSLYIDVISHIKEKLTEIEKQTDFLKINPPTFFELMTLASFLIFVEAECDVMVIETGLGGRLDATNCIDPILSIITRIEKEHTEYLGKRMKQIAFEKGGIIKPQRPVLLTRQQPRVRKQIEKIANQRESKLYKPRDFVSIVSQELYSVEMQINEKIDIPNFQYSIFKTLLSKIIPQQTCFKATPPAPGIFQVENSLTAVAATFIFFNEISKQTTALKKKMSLSKSVLESGISETKLHGRLEKVKQDPSFYIDGAHTPLSFKHSVNTFAKMEGKGGVLLFSAVEGKAIKKMVVHTKDNFNSVIITSAGNFRKSQPDQIWKRIKKFHPEAILQPDIEKAVEIAMNQDAPILCSGSFYLAGEVIKVLKAD